MVTERSAVASAPFSVVMAVVALLAAAGSIALATVAVLTRSPLAALSRTRTVMTNVDSAPAGIAPVVAMTEPPPPTAGVVMDHPATGATSTKVVCDGNGSVIVTPAAVPGP